MKSLYKWLPILLALVVFATACGGETKAPDTEQDNVPDINYGDYVTPVTDRKVADLITAADISVTLGYTVNVVGSYTDSTITYQSADGLHTITLTLENMTRSDFDAITSDPVVAWTWQDGLGETAYWDAPHTELIAYQNGYAVSMSVYNIADAAMISIMESVLNGLCG